MGLLKKLIFFIVGTFVSLILIIIADSPLPLLLVLPLFWFIFLRQNSGPKLVDKTDNNQIIKEVKMNDAKFLKLLQDAEKLTDIDQINEITSLMIDELTEVNHPNQDTILGYLEDCQLLIDQEDTDWEEFFSGISESRTDMYIYLENLADDNDSQSPQSYCEENYSSTNDLIVYLSKNYCFYNAKYEFEREV
jgi:hypothetical protein